MTSNFYTYHFCKWTETLKDIDMFRELVGNKLFDCDFDPIFIELSKRTGRAYIDWLYEARAEIYGGKDPYDVLSHYDIILQDLIMEDKKYGKSYGRSCKEDLSSKLIYSISE